MSFPNNTIANYDNDNLNRLELARILLRLVDACNILTLTAELRFYC